MDVFKRKKNKIFASLAVLFSSVLTLALVFSNVNFKSSFFGVKATQSYQLNLNSSNAVSASGEYDQYTLGGGKVAFTYNNVTSSSGNHVRLNQNGYLVNKDQITSIESIQVHFTKVSQNSKLTLKSSYDGATWGSAWEAEDNETYYLSSNPYFIQLTAFNGAIDIASVTYKYSCSANPAAQGTSYDIPETWQRVSNSNELTSGDEIVIAASLDSSNWRTVQNELYKQYYLATEDITLTDSNTKASVTSSHSVWTILSGSTTGTWKIKADSNYLTGYVNGTHYNVNVTDTYSSSNCDWTLSFSNSNVELFCNVYLKLLYYNSSVYEITGSQNSVSQTCYIYKRIAAHSGTSYDQPLDVIGFTANDLNANEYTTNSVFATDNGLVVKANYNDGSQQTLALGANGYSYLITNSSGVQIDATQKFPEEGQYTLTVSYGQYIPQEITLNVGEYVYVTDVAASMSTTTFNTADTLCTHLEGNLTANIEYSNGTLSNSIAYSEFAANGIEAKLITPKGIAYDMTKPFGTAGTWTVKVHSLTDENIYYNISLTINAIPVQTISLNESTYTLYPEGTIQLVASVNPSTATNTVVDWTSNNESVATVNENGLVTAVAIGGATITASAVDGSGVFGTCSITVVAKPAEPTWEKVTDASTLQVGDVILITNEANSKELDGISSNNYGISTDYDTKPAGLYPLTLEAGKTSGSFALRNGDDYLNCSANKSLSLASSVTNNSSFTISSGSVIANVASTSRKLQYNASSPRFACYESSQAAITLYVQTNATPVAPVYPTSISLTGTSSITIGGTSQLTVGYTPADTNVKNVTFASSATSVATVSNTGLVTGVAQGSATITATAQTENGTTTATLGITVTPISVTSVSLDTNSASVKVGKTVTLVATVYPTNATNKSVSWSSSSTSVATVSNSGVVTGVAAGTSTITVTTADGHKTAQCVVTVTASGGEETFTISYTDLPTSYQTGSTVYTASSGIKFQAYNCANYSSKMQWKASSGYLQTTEDLELQSITINDRESNTLTVYGSNTAGSFSTEISGNNDVYDLTGYSYFKVARTSSGAAYCSSITVVTGTPTPTDPTNIILSPTSADVGVGGTKQLSVSYVPSNANQNKDVTWTSSNTNVATVSSSGLVSVKSTATAGQTAIITARLTNLTSIYATCTITVTAQTRDDHTVLIYMCGADLESGYASSNQGLATGDITEILSVSGQPDDVNIVIETGGASSWSSTYGISSSKLERWHVNNKSLVKDASLTYASMGLTSTLQSFIEYGLNNYPAERTGLIFWNHGGAMRGVCYDEKKSDDSLLANEVTSAVSGALSNCGMSGQKLEWVGYDACLMQVQDIASVNSDYFNYMVASEESEAGEGWDYDTWVDDLYAKKTSPTIFKAIVDGFIKENGGTNSSSNDQTLSYLNLSYMSDYVTAWNNMATQLGTKITSSNKSSFNTLVKSAKYYADSDYTYYGIFDAKDFINKLAANATFNPGSTYTNAVITAFGNLVEYSSCGRGAGNSYGLCMFWSVSSNCAKSTYYTAAMTKFTAWRTLVTTYGS